MHRAIVTALLVAMASGARADACYEAHQSAAATSAYEICRKEAAAGDLEAQFGLGLVLLGGSDRQAKPQEAAEWFRRAARGGHVLARIMLGRYLSDPQAPVEVRNLAEAYAWWVVAGERDAAAELKRRLSAAEAEQGELLAHQFASNYGTSR